MSEPYIGEIIMFGGNFAPRGWALCNGQLLSIAQNTALFSILGTTYGGDGVTTFALPDLRGRSPMNWGQGPGLTPRSIGETGGAETVTLISTQMPAHNHTANATTTDGVDTIPGPNYVWAKESTNAVLIYGQTPDTTMAPNAIGIAGGSQPHQNMEPFLAVSFIIALEGIFPPRS